VLELQPAGTLPPARLSHEEVEKLDELVSTRRRLKRGEHLYRAGEAFERDLRSPQRFLQDRRAA
jgi:hypothetical protein